MASGRAPSPSPTLGVYMLLCFGAYAAGILFVVWLNDDFGRLAEWRMSFSPSPHPLIPPEPLAHLEYALLEIFPRNLGVLLVGGVLLPLLAERAFSGKYHYVRPYGVAVAFVIGSIASPGAVPDGLAYTLKVLPVSLLETGVFGYATYEGVRAREEGRLPKLGGSLLLLLLGAGLETEIIAWLL